LEYNNINNNNKKSFGSFSARGGVCFNEGLVAYSLPLTGVTQHAKRNGTEGEGDTLAKDVWKVRCEAF